MITWFHPSNVKIIILDEKDNRRMKRNKIVKSEEKKAPVKKVETKKKVEEKK